MSRIPESTVQSGLARRIRQARQMEMAENASDSEIINGSWYVAVVRAMLKKGKRAFVYQVRKDDFRSFKAIESTGCPRYIALCFTILLNDGKMDKDYLKNYIREVAEQGDADKTVLYLSLFAQFGWDINENLLSLYQSITEYDELGLYDILFRLRDYISSTTRNYIILTALEKARPSTRCWVWSGWLESRKPYMEEDAVSIMRNYLSKDHLGRIFWSWVIFSFFKQEIFGRDKEKIDSHIKHCKINGEKAMLLAVALTILKNNGSDEGYLERCQVNPHIAEALKMAKCMKTCNV